MFAFAIYDKVARRLFFARDRMGKKPLLYCLRDGTLYLFSELKQAFALGLCEQGVDPSALSSYLVYGSVPGPLTMIRGISSFPPAHFGVFDGGSLEVKRYWSPDVNSEISIPYPDARERVRDLVRSAVQARLVSDVPLGAFLSGGIDSSIIVGIMAEFSTMAVRTYSIRYEDAPTAYDESAFAGLVARKFGTKHHTIAVGPQDIVDNLDDIIYKMDQPSSQNPHTLV
jgi:asparagine synthase (glutamine-hydrolysing)